MPSCLRALSSAAMVAAFGWAEMPLRLAAILFLMAAAAAVSSLSSSYCFLGSSFMAMTGGME